MATPAFPRPFSLDTREAFDDSVAHSAHTGITIQDYFAAHAMAAVMPAVINELKKTRGSIKEAQRLQALSAETCYALADAMIKARSEA
jgi:hypothetical protein